MCAGTALSPGANPGAAARESDLRTDLTPVARGSPGHASAWKVDPHLLKLTRGRFSTAGPLATALLESLGARTGQPRRNATLYFNDGDRVTIIASKRGWPKNPAWYYNLREHPDIVFGGLPFRAEVVEDQAERQRLWDLADRVFPEYAD